MSLTCKARAKRTVFRTDSIVTRVCVCVSWQVEWPNRIGVCSNGNWFSVVAHAKDVNDIYMSAADRNLPSAKWRKFNAGKASYSRMFVAKDSCVCDTTFNFMAECVVQNICSNDPAHSVVCCCAANQMRPAPDIRPMNLSTDWLDRQFRISHMKNMVCCQVGGTQKILINLLVDSSD